MSLWKKCSSCKTEINLNAKYYECSVSSCNGKRTGYVFCSMSCWERHLPGARHRDAAAIEKTAPRVLEEHVPKRRIVNASSASAPTMSSKANQHEILVVASKLKNYVKESADMNTSQSVMGVLSDFLRMQCDRAIENARADGRKTILDRDFK